MKWFRKHWQPTLMDRNSYEDWDAQGRTTMKDRIVKKTRDIIANHEGPISRVPGEAKKDIQKILDEAEERVRSK
jgi:trimethylamine--corrinoid protein Co-methyltransferase